MVDEESAVVKAGLIPMLIGGNAVPVLIPAVQEPLAPAAHSSIQLLQFLPGNLLLQIPMAHNLQDGPAVYRRLDHLGDGGHIVVQVGKLPVGTHPIQRAQEQVDSGIQMGLQRRAVLAHLPLRGDLVAQHDDHGVVDARRGGGKERPEGVLCPNPPLLKGFDELGHGGIEALPVRPHIRLCLGVGGIALPGIRGMGELLHGQGEAAVRSRHRIRLDLPAGELGFIPVLVEAEIGTFQPLEYQGAGPAEGEFPCAPLPGFHGLMLFTVFLKVQAHAPVPFRHQEGGRGESEAHVPIPGEKNELV